MYDSRTPPLVLWLSPQDPLSQACWIKAPSSSGCVPFFSPETAHPLLMAEVCPRTLLPLLMNRRHLLLASLVSLKCTTTTLPRKREREKHAPSPAAPTSPQEVLFSTRHKASGSRGTVREDIHQKVASTSRDTRGGGWGGPKA